MGHLAIKKWEIFRKHVQAHQNTMNRPQLLASLKDLIFDLKGLKDQEVQQLYSQYLSYFDLINWEEYQTIDQAWYRLNELITFEIINSPINSFRHVFTKVRDLSWLLLVFKTDISCNKCNEDEMRVLSDKAQTTLYLCCDRCGLITLRDGEIISNTEILVPTLYEKIKNTGLNPSLEIG